MKYRIDACKWIHSSRHDFIASPSAEMTILAIGAEVFNLSCVVNRDAGQLGSSAALVNAVGSAHFVFGSLFRC